VVIRFFPGPSVPLRWSLRWRLPATAALFAIALSACTGKVELISQVSENQANEVIAALSEQGIAGEKIPGKEGVVSVQVPQDRAARAIEVMQARGLPRTPYASLGEVFKKDGLISSPTEERARLIYALSQELSNTISKIDGVIYAQVHLVLPEHGGFGEVGNPSSAAVFIKHEDTASLDSSVPQIRRLVANSIPGLSYERVSVVLVPSEVQMSAKSSQGARMDVIWGIHVAAGSAGLLRAVLGGLTLAVLGACAGIGFIVFRARRSREAHA
jgi:type III secretion protein J